MLDHDDLSNKFADISPKLEEQRAALLDQADKVKVSYDQYSTAKNDLNK